MKKPLSRPVSTAEFREIIKNVLEEMRSPEGVVVVIRKFKLASGKHTNDMQTGQDLSEIALRYMDYRMNRCPESAVKSFYGEMEKKYGATRIRLITRSIEKIVDGAIGKVMEQDGAKKRNPREGKSRGQSGGQMSFSE